MRRYYIKIIWYMCLIESERGYESVSRYGQSDVLVPVLSNLYTFRRMINWRYLSDFQLRNCSVPEVVTESLKIFSQWELNFAFTTQSLLFLYIFTLFVLEKSECVLLS